MKSHKKVHSIRSVNPSFWVLWQGNNYQYKVRKIQRCSWRCAWYLCYCKMGTRLLVPRKLFKQFVLCILKVNKSSSRKMISDKHLRVREYFKLKSYKMEYICVYMYVYSLLNIQHYDRLEHNSWKCAPMQHCFIARAQTKRGRDRYLSCYRLGRQSHPPSPQGPRNLQPDPHFLKKFYHLVIVPRQEQSPSDMGSAL